MICDTFGVPLEVGQKVVCFGQLVDAKVVEVREIVPPGRPRFVKLVAEFDFFLGDEAGPQPKLPIVVAAAQDREIPPTSRMKQ